MAYGARLESVLGESPQGFESPILRGSQLRKWWIAISKSHGPSTQVQSALTESFGHAARSRLSAMGVEKVSSGPRNPQSCKRRGRCAS